MKSNIEKLKSSFTQIPNKLLHNNIVSLKAKGLFCYLQSRPDDWQFSSERMAKVVKEGIDSIQSGLRELEDNDYLTRTRLTSGRMIYELHLPKKEKANTEGSRRGRPQYITNKDINTNKEHINKQNSIFSKNKEIITSYLERNKVKITPDPETFDWRYAMKGASKRINLFFIALYWKKKDFIFESKEEAGEEIKRLLRKSISYSKTFPATKFKEMLDWIELDSINKGNYEWTFETLLKRLSIFNQQK